MKVLLKDSRRGVVKLLIESLDDLWYLSQVVREGDMVKAKTTRRVKSKDGREGSDERRTFTLGVKVEKVEFKGDVDTLRFLGTISEGPEDVIALGTHHTLNIELDTILTIEKEKWLDSDLSRLNDAVKSALRSKVLIAVIEDGDASFGVVGESKVRYYDFSSQIGGKYDIGLREKNRQAFYKQVHEFLSNTMQKDNVSALILAGPGFEKENLLSYIRDNDPSMASKSAVENTGSGGRNGINEVLKKATIKGVLQNLGAAEDMNLVNRLLEHIGRDDCLAAYGLSDIENAVNMGAIEILLVSDKKFIDQRNVLEAMMKSVKGSSGIVHIVNQESEAGGQLKALGGIAGILRFKIR
jgi:protein pelota